MQRVGLRYIFDDFDSSRARLQADGELLAHDLFAGENALCNSTRHDLDLDESLETKPRLINDSLLCPRKTLCLCRRVDNPAFFASPNGGGDPKSAPGL